MRKTVFLCGLALAVTVVSIIACVNTIGEQIDEQTERLDGGEGKEITFQIAQLEQTRVDTRAEMSIGLLCSNITLALYQGNTRVIKIDQDTDDSKFGTLSTHLPYGNYTLVCLAHSSEGNATTTNLEKISFPSSYVTDTFLYCEDIEVTEETASVKDIVLKRVVTKFEIEMTDKIPDNATMLEIKYTGGSATLNARTGRGVTNSRQHEEFEVVPGTSPNTFEVYSFLFDEEGKLKYTITAYDNQDEEVFSRVFEGVSMKRNNITHFKGNFFGKGMEGTITADSTWTYTNYDF